MSTSMQYESVVRHVSKKKIAATAAILVGAAIPASPVFALNVETGNPALSVQWDTDLRYNTGIRIEGRDSAIANSTAFDSADYTFDTGEFVTNRFDIASGVGLKYSPQNGGFLSSFGGRVSGQAFRDFATDENVSCRPGGAPAINPATGAYAIPGGGPRVSYCDGGVLPYRDGELSKAAKKRNIQDADLLDAFVFANFDVAGRPVSVRAGRHTLYWGESLFNPFLGVSYAMGGVDLNKSISVPGSAAQDVFLPIARISGTISGLLPDVSLQFDLPLDWRGPRAPEGGTYFSPADAFLSGPDQNYAFNTTLDGINPYPVSIPRGEPVRGKNNGAYGVLLRWQPEFMAGGTLGLVARRFDEILPWVGLTAPAVGSGVAPPFDAALPSSYRLVYARKTELYGLTMAREVGGISTSLEFAYSPNRALNSASGVYPDSGGARGQTWSGVFNGIYLGKTVDIGGFKLWDQWTVTAELNGSYLQKVGSGESFFNKVGSAACQAGSASSGNAPTYQAGDKDGCASRYAVGSTVQVTTTWFQVFPGIDLGTSTVYDRGIHNTSPINVGGFEGGASGSFAITADFYRKLTAALAYNYYKTPITKGRNADGEPIVTTFAGLGVLDDRDWLSLTLKYSF